MGCGMSTFDGEDASQARPSNKVHGQHPIVPPINKPIMKKDCDNGDDGVMAMKLLGEEEGSNGDRLKEKCVVDMKEEESRGIEEHGSNVTKNHEEENEDRDDSFIGPGSPSFRDYCNDYDSGDRSSMGDHSNDCDSRDRSDDGSTNRLTNKKSVNFSKEPEKKERRGRGFRSVINKGKTRGRRNLLNFACYNSNNQSYAEGSFNKIAGKTA